MKKTAFVLASVILMNLLGAYGRTDVEEEKEQEQRIQRTGILRQGVHVSGRIRLFR